MMQRIVNFGLRFRVLVAIAALGIVAFGIAQLREAPLEVYPEFTPPFVEVQTEALGLSAAEVEQLITVPLEADLLNGVPWLQDMRSESIPGLSSITLVFEPGTDLFRARQMVQERLSQAHAIPNVSKPPQMLQPVSSTSRTMMIGLSSRSLSLIEISQLARWTIKPRLMGVKGVANVSTFGQRERQLQVHVDPQRLRDNGVALLDVVQTTGNALWVSPLTFLEASTPGTGGFIEGPNQRLGVRHLSPIISAGDLAQVVLERRNPEAVAPPETGRRRTPPPPAAPLRLGDVAQVVEDHQPLIGDALVDNGQGLVMVVEKLPGANTVEVTRGVEAALEALSPGLSGLKVDTSIFQPAEYIRSAKDNVNRALVAGALLLVLLFGLAFRHWRAAVVAAVAVGASLVAAGLVLHLTGTTVNSMVLVGAAVALGVIVDDAVMGTERVLARLRHRGERPRVTTVLEATMETRGSLVYAGILVLLPIAPVFFVGDLLGAFGRPLALTYALALAVSMLTGMLLTPALGLLLLAPRPPASHASTPDATAGARSRYGQALGRTLSRPRRALLVAGLLGLAGLLALPRLGISEQSALKERDFLIELELAPGTSLGETNRLTAQVSRDLRAIPGVRNVASHTGRAVASDRVVDVNSSELWVSIDDSTDYASAVAAIRRVVDGLPPGVDRDMLTYQQERLKEAQSGADELVVARVYGQDLGILSAKATEVRDELAKVDGVANLQVELPVQEPVLEIQVNLERAKQFGIKPGDVRRTAAVLLSGVEVGQLFYDQKVFDVVVWGAPQTRRSPDDVRKLLLDTPSGGQVRLEEVADVRVAPSPDVIEREGAFRRIDVSAQIVGRDRRESVADMERRLDSIQFPLEYRVELLGSYVEGREARTRLLWLAGLVVVGMLLLLQACFGSWRLSAAFLVALALALSGSLVAIALGGGEVSIGAAAGLLAVLAVAARNGIVLVRRYQFLRRREGRVFGPDLVAEGADERLAPTLVTALGTALVFAPFVVLGDLPGYEMLRPMAVVVLCGLLTATLVSLFLVPALYLRFGRVEPESEIDLMMLDDELAQHLEARAREAGAPPPLAGSGVGSEG